MDDVRSIVVPAKLIRVGDYVPFGGFVKAIKKSRTTGLFPKSYITLTFYTGDDYVDYKTEAHIPVDVERIYERIVANKEKK
jgi:hypothetical protein